MQNNGVKDASKAEKSLGWSISTQLSTVPFTWNDSRNWCSPPSPENLYFFCWKWQRRGQTQRKRL